MMIKRQRYIAVPPVPRVYGQPAYTVCTPASRPSSTPSGGGSSGANCNIIRIPVSGNGGGADMGGIVNPGFYEYRVCN